MDVYRRLVESAPDAILVVEDHRIVFVHIAPTPAVARPNTQDVRRKEAQRVFDMAERLQRADVHGRVLARVPQD